VDGKAFEIVLGQICHAIGLFCIVLAWIGVLTGEFAPVFG
jgi:hypothetical protein